MVTSRIWASGLALLVTLLLLSGCMYRAEMERQETNPALVNEEIQRVESALEQYFQERGVYPIKNSDQSTPVYEKYIIDLTKLVNAKKLSSLPRNAYENGGRYYYLLIDPETNPKVKLMDLVMFRQMADLQQQINSYAANNNGQLPLDTPLMNGFYSVNFKVLDRKLLQLKSLYSNQYLPIVIHESGRIGIDYGLEIMNVIRKNDSPDFSEDDDLRSVLVEAYPYVPVFSFPYRWINKEPMLSHT